MSIEDDRIEKLKRKLYSRTEEPLLDVRSKVTENNINPTTGWGDDVKLRLPDDIPMRTQTHPFLKKFLIF